MNIFSLSVVCRLSCPTSAGNALASVLYFVQHWTTVFLRTCQLFALFSLLSHDYTCHYTNIYTLQLPGLVGPVDIGISTTTNTSATAPPTTLVSTRTLHMCVHVTLHTI
jgi:hypothetical protein